MLTNFPAASGNTSYKDDDFLKLNPTMGQPTTTESSTGTNTGATGQSSLPIIPLAAESSTTSSGQTTDNMTSPGISEKVWKPTELDEVKQSGAPGAGPEAPDYKPATPDLSSTTSNTTSNNTSNNAPKEHVRVGAGINTASDESAKSDTPTTVKKDGVEYAHSETAKAQPSVGGPIEEILNKGTSSKDEHTVPESDANDPHSKMSDKTVRAKEAHKTDVGDVESMKQLWSVLTPSMLTILQATPQRSPPAARPSPAGLPSQASLSSLLHQTTVTRRVTARCRDSRTSLKTSFTLATRTNRCSHVH
jgi:hypothetical protein